MKTFFLMIALIILLNINIYSQWVYSPNSGGDVNSIVLNGSKVFAGGWGSGVYISTDNGASWNQANQGLNNLYVNTMAVSGNNIYAGTGDDFGGGGVYFSSDNGANWNLIGLNNIWIHSLGVNGNMIFAGTNGKGVFLSTNNGTNWTPLNTGIDTNYSVTSFAFIGNNIFAGTNGKGIYLSTNNGTDWTTVNQGLTHPAVTSLAVNGNKIYAGCADFFGGGLYMSSDNGNNWNYLHNGIDTTVFYVQAVAVSGNNIFLGTVSLGVYFSPDNGSSWHVINKGLGDTIMMSIAANGVYVYAGIYSGVNSAKISDFGLEGVPSIDNSNNNDISISPNPAKNYISISSLNSGLIFTDISIINSLGEIMIQVPQSPWSVNPSSGQKGVSTQQRIDISSLPSGVYYCIFNTSSNKVVKSFVIVR